MYQHDALAAVVPVLTALRSLGVKYYLMRVVRKQFFWSVADDGRRGLGCRVIAGRTSLRLPSRFGPIITSMNE